MKRKPKEIWRGWSKDIPPDLSERFSYKISEAGYVVLFDTGDVVIMKSNEPLTAEQQKPINEILSKMWDNLPIEEKIRINNEAKLKAAKKRIS